MCWRTKLDGRPKWTGVQCGGDSDQLGYLAEAASLLARACRGWVGQAAGCLAGLDRVPPPCLCLHLLLGGLAQWPQGSNPPALHGLRDSGMC